MKKSTSELIGRAYLMAFRPKQPNRQDLVHLRVQNIEVQQRVSQGGSL